MGKKFFIVGGAKSGKSDFAQKIAENINGIRTYIATAIPIDDEMKEKIKKHKLKRNPKIWHNLIEEPYNLSEILISLNSKTDVAIVDCLTLWLTNLLLKYENYEYMLEIVNNLIETIKQINYNIVLVSNEVGMGIVPDNKLARIFREISGIMNQKLASISDEFYFIFSGYPFRLK